MWSDSLPEGWHWSSLWYSYIRCPTCPGIRKYEESCPACGKPMPAPQQRTILLPDGKPQSVAEVYAGGEGGYEDYAYLDIIEQEWKRDVSSGPDFSAIAASHRPSQRAVLAIVFWAYFEARIERLLRSAMRDLPERVTADLLQRYGSIGARLDRLYRLLFSCTYWNDLETLGFGKIAELLKRLQEQRNQFAHGRPEALDDTLIHDLVESLKDEHESWIAVFNLRAATVAPLAPP